MFFIIDSIGSSSKGPL